MGSKTLINLALQIDLGEDSDEEELDYYSRQLLSEIQMLDVESVEAATAGAAPEGTKAVEAVTLGMLAVAALPAALPKLIELVQSWSLRGESRKVKVAAKIGDKSVEIEYNPETTSQAELKQTVDTFLKMLADHDNQ